MQEIEVANRSGNHTIRLLHDLSKAGWIPKMLPKDHRLSPNRELIEFTTPHRSIRLRVSIYRIGHRGEPHRLAERRVEITTTYRRGLPKLQDWADIVLGYDATNDVYVGLDPRRLGMGGKTHNASSFIDPEALSIAPKTGILVRPHESTNLGLEYQAIFKAPRLAEYMFNWETIHKGLYRGEGLFSGKTKQITVKTWELSSVCVEGHHLTLANKNPKIAKNKMVPEKFVEACETDDVDALSGLSPGQLDNVLKKCKEVGDSGEHYVYRYERKRLHKAGRDDLAERINWVSQKSVGKGFDIRSFEIDGTPRLIEVKATIGTNSTFFVSNHEWQVAQNKRACYWIYRVVKALGEPRIGNMLQDPVGAEAERLISRVPDGWRITIA